jgi:hypothetical protein
MHDAQPTRTRDRLSVIYVTLRETTRSYLRVLTRTRTNAAGRKLHVDLLTCNKTSCHESSMPTMLLRDDDATFLNGEPGRGLDMYLSL